MGCIERKNILTSEIYFLDSATEGSSILTDEGGFSKSHWKGFFSLL